MKEKKKAHKQPVYKLFWANYLKPLQFVYT